MAGLETILPYLNPEETAQLAGFRELVTLTNPNDVLYRPDLLVFLACVVRFSFDIAENQEVFPNGISKTAKMSEISTIPFNIIRFYETFRSWLRTQEKTPLMDFMQQWLPPETCYQMGCFTTSSQKLFAQLSMQLIMGMGLLPSE
jgi:hypothetical protein